MKRLKWSIVFQGVIIIIGLIIGMHFSLKSNQLHTELYKEISFHASMHHGSMDISGDSIIPEIQNLKVVKDPISGWNLHFDTKNFKFTPQNAHQKHIPGEGHVHLLINGNKAARLYSNWFHIPKLGYELLTVEVTLNTNSHAAMSLNENPISIKLKNF